MANRIPTLLATAVAAACSLSAHANGPTQADFAKVVLYSNVTIAQDSSSQWGIWEELEPTAAGPQTPLPLLAGTTELYRPVGVVTPDTPVTPPTIISACASGGLCGFGAMTLSTESWNDETAQVAAVPESNKLRVGFQLFPQTNGEPSWLPESMTVSTQPVRSDVANTVPSFNNLGPLEFDGFNSHSHETPRDNLPVGAEGVAERVRINTDIMSLPSEVQAGMFEGDLRISRYVSGGPDVPPLSSSTQSGIIYGVWGITTSAQDMNNLRLSNAQANYSGNLFSADGTNNGAVKMNVNFGSSQFSASFSNVGGGQVALSNGSTVGIKGTLNFQASGSISGSQFSSNALSMASGKPITGNVVGAFFGPQAAVAGGVIDVTADPTPAGNSTARIAARYVSPFIATKQVESDRAPR